MRMANQSQSPAKSAEITDQKEMDQCIFTMEDFKHTCDLSDCSHMTRLQRIDQLFGFFADEPDYQKQYEHEIIAFPIRNPLINIKDAYRIAQEELIPDVSVAPSQQAQAMPMEEQGGDQEASEGAKQQKADEDGQDKPDCCHNEEDIL